MALGAFGREQRCFMGEARKCIKTHRGGTADQTVKLLNEFLQLFEFTVVWNAYQFKHVADSLHILNELRGFFNEV